MSVRIGFIGSSGTGKTTTLEDLIKARPDIEIQSVPTRDLFGSYGFKTHEDSLLDTKNKGLLFQQELIKKRSQFFLELAQTDKSFVSDRTPLDCLVYYMIQNSFFDSAEMTEALTNMAIDATNSFTHLFYFPPNKFPLSTDGGVRGANKYYHGYVGDIMEMTLENTGIRYSIMHNTDREQRIQDILETIAN